MKHLPKIVRDWLHSLPKKDKERELKIAERNLARIAKHQSK